MIIFYSDRPHRFISYRQLPTYPATAVQLARGEGITFDSSGMFMSNDERLITALKAYIAAFEQGRDKNPSSPILCPIWEQGAEEPEDQEKIIEKYVEQKAEAEKQSKLYNEFISSIRGV